MHYYWMDPASKRLPEQSSHMVFHTACTVAGFQRSEKKYHASLTLSHCKNYAPIQTDPKCISMLMDMQCTQTLYSYGGFFFFFLGYMFI